MPKVTIPNPEAGFTCAVRLLEEARDVIQRAADNHVYDQGSGEKPAALAEQGIRSLTVECTSTGDRFVCRDWTYDVHLVDEGTLEQEAPNVDLPKEALP